MNLLRLFSYGFWGVLIAPTPVVAVFGTAHPVPEIDPVLLGMLL